MLSGRLVRHIENLLRIHERLRDDDDYLIAMVWRYELEGQHSESNFSILGKIARHELANTESIRRNRQKLQEEYPELRGNKWDERHKKLEPKVRKEIREFKGPQQELL